MGDLEPAEKVAVVLYLVATFSLTVGTFLLNGGVGGALVVLGLCTAFGAACVLAWNKSSKY